MAASGKRWTRLATGVAAAGVATCVVGLAATQPASIASTVVDLTALIVVGSSTNPTGAGVAEFFGGKFDTPRYTDYHGGGDVVYVDFRTGPGGIEQALRDHAGEHNAVLASGWGAANASLLLLRNRTDLKDTVFILDNDVARPDGGFGTRYPWFALIGVNPIPTPSNVPALRVVNTGYEYDYNSNAPADVLNPVAAVNSLVGYLYTRLNQSERELPVDAEGKPTVHCDANTCAILATGGVLDCPDAQCSAPTGDRITAYVTERGNTTYVTYTAEELPLTRLIRDVFGDQLAELTGPVLKLAVDSAYYGGNPIPRDPSAYRPARIAPPPDELLATAVKVPGAILQGLSAASSPRPTVQPETAVEQETTVDPEPTVEPETTQRRTDSNTLANAHTTRPTGAGDPDTAQKRRPQLNVLRDSVRALPGKLRDSFGPKRVQRHDDSAVTGPALGTADDAENDAAGGNAGAPGEGAKAGADAAA
ncbi:PE-PPE domain-containing protein [Mycolicibacterium flavescens]|uniref:PE-PPE domain-containing protein n=1 Tax=Mycobacterium neumannii TaxID=2048551 RepID=UPI000B9458A2|nr:PE-PPE domain-containing protein [Mycobacterium neumannii]VEG39905.1 PE-PPE domain-containing protein [Mycolicibacterium flavescens]